MLQQCRLGLKPQHAPVAVTDRVHPREAVVSAGDGDQPPGKAALDRVHLLDPLQKRGHRTPIRRLVRAHRDVAAAESRTNRRTSNMEDSYLGCGSNEVCVQIGARPIGSASAPFIIAEMSGNHNQSLDRALAIVDAAADAGAHAIKLQTYTADTMTLAVSEREFFISDPGSLWTGSSLHDLYKLAYTPWEWHAPIMARAQGRGMECFSSPFD